MNKLTYTRDKRHCGCDGNGLAGATGYVHKDCGCGGGLGEASGGVTNALLVSYIQRMAEQEGGRLPDQHKLNGNMAWYERSVDPSHPMNQYFDSLGRSGIHVLADLKSRVPQAFGLSSSNSAALDSSGTNADIRAQDSGGGSDTIFGMSKKTMVIGGSIAVGGIILLVALT